MRDLFSKPKRNFEAFLRLLNRFFNKGAFVHLEPFEVPFSFQGEATERVPLRQESIIKRR